MTQTLYSWRLKISISSLMTSKDIRKALLSGKKTDYKTVNLMCNPIF